MNSAEESARAFIVSGGDGPVVLEFCEEVLDQVSGLIHILVVFALFLAV